VKVMKSISLFLLATSCVVSPLAVVAQTPVLLRTFNNPIPATDDFFGSAMVALGSDRVLIGAQYDDTTATNAGAVYLFHTNGSLLTTFTNPHPAYVSPYADNQFGCALATLGGDRVVIGSPQSAKTYLFTTNGALVQTLNSSNIYDYHFGDAVAAVGNDRVLIGAHQSYFNSDLYYEDGVAYLYSTNGTLLTTFNNPQADQVNFKEFGYAVAAFGSDRVLISANDYGSGHGAAYLFNTNGALLTTFTNPAPVLFDYFGHSIAAASTDRILVGAPGSSAAANGGAVYLFNTNGTLLLTITNPTPAVNDRFGEQMAMLGNDRVIIGASGDDTGVTDAGSAYVYDVDGTLIATLNNPAPASGDWFGSRVAAFGNEGAIIGAIFDDAGATNAGSAYLFSVPAPAGAPSLTIQRTTTNTVVVSWPSPSTGFVLQQNTNGISTVNWSNATVGVQIVGTNETLIVNPIGGSQFYRLVKP
jgi:hypothetical protein